MTLRPDTAISKILFSILFMIIISSCFANEKGDQILGVWLMANKNVKVQIYKINNQYEGKVVWMDTDTNKKNFQMGEKVIDQMEYDPNSSKYRKGHFYGRGYKLDCELRLVEPDRLEITVSKGPLKQVRYSTRVKSL